VLQVTDWAGVLRAAASGAYGDTEEAGRVAAAEAAAQAELWDSEGLFEERSKADDDSAAPHALPVHILVRPACQGAADAAWSFAMHLDSSAVAEEVTLPSKPDASQPSDAARGLRWRLLPPAPARRLPPDGVLVASLQGAAGDVKSLSGRLQLPTLRCGLAPAGAAAGGAGEAEEAWKAAPPFVWVTLGSLRGDGWALQLRCARVRRPEEAATDAQGRLLLYRPAGGALTRERRVDTGGVN
jgi:hypothetical protein